MNRLDLGKKERTVGRRRRVLSGLMWGLRRGSLDGLDLGRKERTVGSRRRVLSGLMWGLRRGREMAKKRVERARKRRRGKVVRRKRRNSNLASRLVRRGDCRGE